MITTSKIKRVSAAIYFIWLFVHLGLLYFAEDSQDSSEFWPFIKPEQTLQNTYDVSEFLIYVGVPLILYITYKILFDKQSEEYYSTKRHATSGSFFISFLNEKIKAEERAQKINELTGQSVNYSQLEELKNDLKKLSSHEIDGWLDRVAVRKKYKDFEK